ncbi:MAG: TerC family protein [Elusimicrobiales bacterium]|nr:TerC family protein [Elusimicrobiales bacterium]
MTSPLLLWTIFGAVMAAILYIDLGLLNRHSHIISMRRAGAWVAVWVALALLFCAGIWWKLGETKALEFLTAYIIEYSLSVDNLFVFALIFVWFRTAPQHQPRILNWGILGAVVMRLLMILAGVALISRFRWMIYVFGAALLYTAWKMLVKSGEETAPGDNPALRLLKKYLPFTDTLSADRFFVYEAGVWFATPLFATLVVVEASDVVFAIDSIPAVLAISRDPFIVYTSNVFAILGLRSLYFLLAGMLGMFAYLKYGISVILFFVGVKMLVSGFYHIPTVVSLAVVACGLAVSVLASVLFPAGKK